MFLRNPLTDEIIAENIKGERGLNSIAYDNGKCRFEWEAARSIPVENQWFETIWNAFMNDEIVE